MKTAVVIPTYNEYENLPLLVAGIRKLDFPIKIIIVDDNSPDGTGALADTLAADDRGIKVLHRAKKLGLGTAHLAGFAEALPEASLILTMDADLSHNPSHIPGLIAKAEEGCDVVLGSRYIKNGSVDFKPWRRALSNGGNLFAATILGFRTRDNTSGFRCYRRAALQTILAKPPVADGYSFLVEILYQAKRAGFIIGEAPINYADRQYGETKVSSAEIYKALGTVCRLRFRP